MNPKVSVIIPFYNSEETLGACLESMRSQTLEDIEIILVDDGSSDGGLEVARCFAAAYQGLCTVISSENGGPSAARNRGLNIARGEFVAFVDSDDFIDPRMYEKMYASACAHGSDIVSCGRVVVNSESGEPIRTKVPGYEFLMGPISHCPDIVKRVGPLMCDKIFRRSIIESNQIRFDEDIWHAEDFLFGTRVKLHANCVSAVPEPLYHYVQVDGSVSSGMCHLMDIPESCRRVVLLYEQAGLLEIVSGQLMFVLAGYYLRRCRALPASSDLWCSFKGEMRDLFTSYFKTKWRAVVAKRILREDKALNAFPLLWKALL